MARVHFLNVGKGDSCIIQHVSGRTTMIDISKGNLSAARRASAVLLENIFESSRLPGNFGMSRRPTNPIEYLESIGVDELFRFVLTHPDMDHLDGFDALTDQFPIRNFWDSGVRREKPDFEGSPYREEDWNRYIKFRDGKEAAVTVVKPRAKSQFQFANKNEANQPGGDGLHVLAPEATLVASANDAEICNDGSYVLLYRSAGGRILIPGDAQDETWEYVVENFPGDVANCSILFAPHHGRRSGCNFDFLDIVQPKLTLFGCASSGHLGYDEWSSRQLRVITNNQAGNVVLEIARAKLASTSRTANLPKLRVPIARLPIRRDTFTLSL
jgi:competence protein ComEC